MGAFGTITLAAFVFLYIVLYRRNSGENVYKYVSRNVNDAYQKFAPYSFQVVRQKVKDLGQEYSAKQYTIQIAMFSVGAFLVSYMYFYNLFISAIYAVLAATVIPYLTYLRCKRIYSEFIFEQIQVYTTNVIMEFATTQSFVKALEGVYDSGVLEDPIKSDIKAMIEMAYQNGTINDSLAMMSDKYDYFIVKNMHQLFLQITNEGSKDSGKSLDNMSLDIDMLVENVYRDRMDRASFHKKFLQFGLVLYLMVMLIQFLLGIDTYINMLNKPLAQVLLHGIVFINTFFLLKGEKYYNENVGAE